MSLFVTYGDRDKIEIHTLCNKLVDKFKYYQTKNKTIIVQESNFMKHKDKYSQPTSVNVRIAPNRQQCFLDRSFGEKHHNSSTYLVENCNKHNYKMLL
jgi:hypothetical protein